MAADFVFEYFCKPILQREGYNLVNTGVYAAILLVIAFGLVIPWLKKTKLPLDHRFLAALLPFIVLGSGFRVFEDLGLVHRSCNPLSPWFYTITPGIYIAVGILTILALWISLKINGKNTPEKNPSRIFKIFGGIGIVLTLPVLFFLGTRTIVWDGIAGVFFLAALTTAIAVLASKRFSKTKKLFEILLNRLVFFGQMLDANATFVSLQFYNCSEQHVLSAGIISSFGPFAFVIVKFALMYLVLYFADKEIEDEKTRQFVKILIGIIGFAPGIRDALTLGVGTCL
ncbi:MAG: DUF63 family protein [Candidatus Micrarchaeota archaeon]